MYLSVSTFLSSVFWMLILFYRIPEMATGWGSEIQRDEPSCKSAAASVIYPLIFCDYLSSGSRRSVCHPLSRAYLSANSYAAAWF